MAFKHFLPLTSLHTCTRKVCNIMYSDEIVYYNVDSSDATVTRDSSDGHIGDGMDSSDGSDISDIGDST